MAIANARIKQEVDDNVDMDLNNVNIINEGSNMITVVANDHKSEDERKFIESLATIDPDQLLSESSINYPCKFCPASFEYLMEFGTHMVLHQMNRHLCRFGCLYWCESLEQILEHEYQKHSQGLNKFCCRVCDCIVPNAHALRKHMLIHVHDKRYVCALCRRHFGSHQGLQLHHKHTKEICGQVKYINGVSHRIELVATSEKCQLPAELLCDVQIKEEPKDEENLNLEDEIFIKEEPMVEELNTEKESLQVTATIEPIVALDWRSKLRLPALKRKPEPQTAPQSGMKIVKLNDQLTSNAAILKKPNILKRDPNLDSITTKKSVIPENILKILPNNCMVIRLPLNTKILKLPQEVNKTTLNHSRPPSPGVVQITQVVKQVSPSNNNPIVDTISVQSSPPKSNRLGSFHHEAFYELESRPESKKMIEEIQNQIRSIESTLPLPGSVLQTKSRKSPSVTNKSQSDVKDEPTKLELLLNSMCTNVWKTLFEKYPNYRFYWLCPICGNSFEQAQPLRHHLSWTHVIDKEKLDTLKVTLLPKKVLLEGAEQIKSSAENLTEKTSAVPQLSADLTTVNTNERSQDESPISKNPIVPKTKSTCAQQQHECNVCSKTYTTSGALRVHKMIHTGELPYKCNFCDKRFRTPGQVKVHHRRHTGEKPFKCKICSLDFTHRETLISHLSRHIGMKRYKCYGCDQYFVVVSGLRAHRRLRPDTCGKVKFTARAHGPRVRVIKGEVIFEGHPEHNGYLRSEDPLNIISERNQSDTVTNPIESKAKGV